MRFQAAESLAEQIAQYIGQQIITGALAPKQRVQELKVAAELNVSRGSVREALLLLERRHLVNIFARRGAVVADLTVSDAESLYDMYASLLATMAKLAARNWQDGELAPIEAHLRHLERLSSQPEINAEQLVEEGFGLMDLCIPIADNPFLTETLQNFRFAVSRMYFLATQGNPQEFRHSVSFFSGVIDAVRQRDSETIDKLVNAFAQHQKQLLTSFLETSESTGSRSAFSSRPVSSV
ncbi:GntR family transcriptional regulator [Allohahella sp. A8]|uniref:GntR family transcriptional regulator n=1 Tax=Allohahella sp. A8 TaxID=3141461 RepID=UPI000C0913FD|nr:GntR family transcriptional regulator [Hahellaceae bacterium]|tara:strand:- start:9749 stop:10462 length:714 start_codon:yes stop_codon:yes gene_type:complete